MDKNYLYLQRDFKLLKLSQLLEYKGNFKENYIYTLILFIFDLPTNMDILEVLQMVSDYL